MRIRTGKRVVKITERRTRQDCAGFMKEPGGLYPDARRIRLIQDNLNTRTGGPFYETSDGRTVRSPVGRFGYHCTPEKAGLPDTLETGLSALSENCPDRRIASAEELQSITGIRVRQRNGSCAKIRRQFSTADAREKFKRFYKN